MISPLVEEGAVGGVDGVLFAAAVEVEIGSEKVRTALVVELADEAGQAELSCHLCIDYLRVGEELGDDEQIGSLAPGFVEKVLGDVNGGTVGVVEAESIEYAGHASHILGHVLPQFK